ncbi:hypothetical protein QYE76_050553 [Lolium multiflorum]|uniref:mRNA cap-binding protein n=1 Tax=Lolium multiflorum TaxID=4521 RepID=A0AAD8WHE3_LOLMU|nr:hypothetical protein QYE76_050553 [Lolium multiflorum]
MAASKDAEMEEAEIGAAAAAAGDDSAGAAHMHAADSQPLKHAWAFWLGNAQEHSGSRGSTIHTFSTIDYFWSLYNSILHPSKLGVGADLYCLKNKIQPKWEDPISSNGGEWTISVGRGKSDTLWLHTLLALIGQKFEYDDEICGAVLSVRVKEEVIGIWTKDAVNEFAQLSISKQWKEFLDYNNSIEFIIHDSGTAAVQCWSSKFPEDPLDIIYNRVPGPLSRVRFAAVCRSWCATAKRHPAPLALPWLLLSPRDSNRVKRLYCLEDNQIMRIPLPTGLVNHWIVNLFSGFEIALSEKQKWIPSSGRLCQPILWKIIFSEPPTSSDCILATITDHSSVALCRIGCPDGGWTTHGINLADIAFCNGELYGLTRREWKLVKFETSVNEEGAPVVTAIDQLLVTMENQQPHHVWLNNMDVSYIFELNGKLAMAARFPWSPNHSPFFKVFELVDNDTVVGMAPGTYKWAEVTSLGDFALFLGPNCSMAVHVPEDRHGGVQRNRIYYTHCRCIEQQDVLQEGGLVFLARSNDSGYPVYLREDEHDGVEMIRAVGYYVRGGPIPPMWLLPPDL